MIKINALGLATLMVLGGGLIVESRAADVPATWNKNCLSIGLAAGFMEPLESTSLHLMQSGIMRFLPLLPTSMNMEINEKEYNRLTIEEYENIRDFIILHYKVTNRQDSPFWRHCSSMPVPDSLAHRIDLFRETARVFKAPNELFAENSWIQVMLGQGIEPEQYHPVTNVLTEREMTRFMQGIKSNVDETVAKLPNHQLYVEQYAKVAG